MSDRTPLISLAVVTAREKVKNNRWLDERWRIVGVVMAKVESNGNIARTPLRVHDEEEQYLWTGLALRLHPSEADSYYYNIVGQNPSLYVYCSTDDSGELCPQAITVDYIDAMAHSETGNATHAVAMPPEVYRTIEQYVLEHYTPEAPKMKRKHEGQSARSGAEDEG